MTMYRQSPRDPPPERKIRPPIPEHYAGDNNPYRGTEAHGVQKTVDPLLLESGTAEATKHVEYVALPKEQDPVPVIIVQEKRNELKTLRTYNYLVRINYPVCIVQRREGRIQVRIHNLDGTNKIYVGKNDTMLALMGFPILPNTNLDLWDHEDEVWAIAETADINIRVLERIVLSQ